MGNRSKVLAVGALAGAAVAAARRRARLRAAAEGIADSIMPFRDEPVVQEPPPGVGHAPGHRHLPAEDPGRAGSGRPPGVQGGRRRTPYAPD